MYIKKDNDTFTIDLTAIGGTSTHKREIRLPYTGKLPISYDTAYLLVRLTPDHTGLMICAKQGKGETRYIVEATKAEIKSIIEPLFFTETKPGTYKTRFDNGLTSYWTGHYQEDFMLWDRYTSGPAYLSAMARQLTPAHRAELLALLQRMEA